MNQQTHYTNVLKESDLTINSDHLHDDFKTMIPDITCPICFAVAYPAVSCAECAQLFCKNCIQDWLKRTSKCPNDHEFKETAVNRLAKNLLNSVKIKCVNHGSGCKKDVFYSNYIDHSVKECEFAQFKCTACDMIGNKSLVMMHVNICEKFDENCPYCGVIVKRKFMSDHIKVCDLKTIECDFCDAKILRKESVSHLNTCEERLTECYFCGMKYKIKLENKHTKDICFKEYAEKLKLVSNSSNNNLRSQSSQNNSAFTTQINELNKTIYSLNANKTTLENRLNVLSAEKDKVMKDLEAAITSNQLLVNTNASLQKSSQDYKNGYEQWKAYAEKIEKELKNIKMNSSSQGNVGNIWGNPQTFFTNSVNNQNQGRSIFGQSQQQSNINSSAQQQNESGLFGKINNIFKK